MDRKKTKLIILFFWILVFSLCSLVLAQERELEVEYPKIGEIKPETVATGLPEYVKYIFNFAVMIFGLVVLGVLIRGGIIYLTSAGKPAQLREAREQIISAFLGLIILFSSYIIFTTINPELAIFKLPLLPWEAPPVVEAPKYEAEETTLLSYEVPLGQMIEKGIWDEEELKKATDLLTDFENFLKKEYTIDGETFNKISNLNKYLKTLTDKCRCEKLNSLCTEPQNWVSDVACAGNPCEEVRDKIKQILADDEEILEELQNYRKEIEKQYQIFTDREDKFFTYYDELEDCLERGSLVNLSEYLEQLKFYEEQGWKTKIIRSPWSPETGPLAADPLTFFCSTGGTVFDISGEPIFEVPTELAPTPEAAEVIEQAYCPIYVPLGEMIDLTLFETIQSAEHGFDTIMGLIDELSKEIRNLANLVSECNSQQNCEPDCSCPPALKNPCFLKYCGCFPTCPCPEGMCPNPCWPNPGGPIPSCLIPCLNGTGSCVGKNPELPYKGSPCPRTSDCADGGTCPSGYECKEGKCMKDEEVLNSIEEVVGSVEKPKETPGKIKTYEDMIFDKINDAKASFSQKPYVIQTLGTTVNLLDSLREAEKFCFSPSTVEEGEFPWALLGCEMAIGSYGLDGNPIADCHPHSFFCCNPDKKTAAQAKKIAQPESGIPGSYRMWSKDEPNPYGPSTADDSGCPQGWSYQGGVKSQCADAAEPIKSLLTCMAQELDAMEQTNRGSISSFTDRRLYTSPPQCDWGLGGCCVHTHIRNTCGKQRGISCHYGGKNCYLQHKSYAVDIATKNIIVGNAVVSVAKQCGLKYNREVFALWQKPGHYNHVHVSIGFSYGCGCDRVKD